ncbi:ABC transporter substrate-binding protein [Fusobacterium sp.]|uniref:ABC transporter substrate-binding protein n=1 Tax=Fusobacterium sp. TaxID=68766 RepID=UPI002916FBE9|nr:ABC transporter substrate-binding protein [Fusobacterium sp.]
MQSEEGVAKVKKIIILIISFFTSISLYSYEIKDNFLHDSFGNSIELKKYNRMVIIDLAVVETIFMLNGEECIAGIVKNSQSKVWPYEKTENLASVGTPHKPSFEKIISLEPDLVILNEGSALASSLKELNIPFIFHNSLKSPDTILESIKIFGVLLNKENNADILYNESWKKLKNIKEKEKINPLNLKGMIVYSASPLVSFSNKYLPGKALTYMGVENIAGDLTGNMPIISSEHILAKNLDVIIVSKNVGGVEELLKVNPLLSETKAAKEKNIIVFDAIDFLRGSPRLFETMEVLYKQLSEIKK